MVNRVRFFSVHGSNPVRWAKRNGLEPFTHPCSECGKELTTTVPIAFASWRGLSCPPCECGNENVPYCIGLTSLRDIAKLP